jgi:UDP-2,3-diacylglucosamine hydrolase
VAVLFISDLHLKAEQPETIRLFLDFLATEAAGSDALYILGDLFEAWLGDDLPLPGYDSVIDALKKLSDSGVALYIMRGNRDFLLGERFARQSGAELIDDPTLIDLYGTPTLLMHGDLLCTDDLPYQAMRAQLRDPQWVAAFLAKSPEERIEFARQLRERSRKETGEKSEAIMDVNPDAVTHTLKENGVTRLVHGHTHRPDVHRLEFAGGSATRYVLGDWHEQGSVLSCDENGCRLRTIP